MGINAGGKTGPRPEAILLAMLEAYHGTHETSGEDFQSVVSGTTNRILHPGLAGAELLASNDDLHALVDEGFIAVQIVDRYRTKRITLREEALAAWQEDRRP